MTSEVKLEPTAEEVERVANAINDADVGYRMTLIRLVDGIYTYELVYDGEAAIEFDNTDDLYEHVGARKREAMARAAILAMDRRASPAAEPVEWQHHIRVSRMDGGKQQVPFEWTDWTEWREGKFGSPGLAGDDGLQFEERPLYASPPAPAVAVKPIVSTEMVNAAWNKAKDFGLSGSPTDFRRVLEEALALVEPAPAVAVPVAWMNADHIRAYQDGLGEGIAWASPEPTDFYTVPLALAAALRLADEPFGYWCEQKYAEPTLIRPPAYIPAPGPNVKVTPLYASAPPTEVVNWSDNVCDNTDDAPYLKVLGALRHCALHWVPEARIVGNIRAGDIVRALDSIASPPAPAVAVPEGWREAFAAIVQRVKDKGLRIEREANALQDVGASLEAKIRIKVADEFMAMLAAAPPPPATRSYEEGIEAAARIADESAKETESVVASQVFDSPARHFCSGRAKEARHLSTAIRSLADEPRHGE
ncbi:hypothetical protein [Kaistia adipata]|uniref:hypothetical protein n=1 Tax=Kaistia adipata TaxID=166954 RepID=UPI0003FAA18A|nr:hypothetical protein [Kaistia adipata]